MSKAKCLRKMPALSVAGDSARPGKRRGTEIDTVRPAILRTAPALALVAAALVALVTVCSPRLKDPLAAGFASPPAEARPWVYWMWMDGNLDRAGITADLESLARAGIGGVVICEVNVGVPRGPVEFMSPEWRKLFAHVVREAERLGLEITLNAGPGWTGSGGPWVKPEQSMQHIVASATDVTGPARFDAPLARPKRRPAFFGESGLPPEIKKTMDDYYRDVAVLAFPSPRAGAAIPDIDEKALYVRAPYSSQAGVRPFFPSPAAYPAVGKGEAIDPARTIDLSDRLTADGRLAWDVPAGRWTILRFGRTTTGANTRPAPVPGLGLECDKLDKAALDAHYDAFVGALLREIGPRQTDGRAGWTHLHIDSWEMGAQNWTGPFREEFRRRRGYDPLPYLPTVTGRIVKDLETSERFLWDLRQTANELVVENHAAHLKELGRRDGFRLSIEPYDMTPCADMTLGTVADTPMGEFWLYGFHTAHSVIEAVSVGHTGGRPVIAAEAFTSSDEEAWRAHPASMKALGDWALAAGINRIVFHRSQHQAALAARPGMTMGPYGVHWERTQTWWEMAPAFHAYLARAQFMLRRGLPVADVCFLVAEGAPQVFRAPESALAGSPPDRLGWNFDACAPETLMAGMTVEDGRLVLPDGMSYRVLVLPDRETMTPALLEKVRDLVAAGATVIGPRPQKSPGLAGFPDCDARVKALADEIWGDCDGVRIKEHAYGKGRVVWARGLGTGAGQKSSVDVPAEDAAAKPDAGAGQDSFSAASGSATAATEAEAETWHVGAPPLNEPAQYGDFAEVVRVLEGMKVAPDFASDGPVRYVHRREGEADIYFVANKEDRTLEASCMFRVSGKQPELWDAVTGEVRDLSAFKVLNGCTQIPLRFEPHQSFFVVFRKSAPQPSSGIGPSAAPGAGARPAAETAENNKKTEAAESPIDHSNGPDTALGREPAASRNFPPDETIGDITGPWDLSFDPKWGGPEKITFESLDDWSRRPEEGIKYYSGVATYRKTFDMPAIAGRGESGGSSTAGPETGKAPHAVLERRPSRLWLDLAAVNNIARVTLNGRDLGIVWCAPWRVEITKAIKAKANRLEIAVANLWPNRLIGDEQLAPDCEYGPDGNLQRWPDWLTQGKPRPSSGRFTFTTWKHFTKDSPLLPSGLLGPVTIRTQANPEAGRLETKPAAAGTLSQPSPKIDQVIVVFKTHFDIGYTDLASNVVRRYRTGMIDDALRVADENRGLAPERRFVWTLPGWPLARIMEDGDGQTPERKARVMEAFREGRFVVHALPFTTHTELLEPEDLVRGLGFASRLSRQAGLPLPRDAKMTDVPSHSWILPTLLRRAGVGFLHLGCNAASSSPRVPALFYWEGPDGSRLLTMYSAAGYGTGLLPPADWPYRTWLALYNSGDNQGPPAPDEVRAIFDEAEKKLPGVKVRIGRLSDFADAVAAENAAIPVVHGDMPDTWIHGPMSDPVGSMAARDLRPAIGTAEALGTMLDAWGIGGLADSGAAIAKAYEESLLFGEHTWGGALYWVTEYGNKLKWGYGDEWKKDRAAGRFEKLERSWGEHRAYIDSARALVEPVLREEMRALAGSAGTEGDRIVVFNPLPYERDGVVTMRSPDFAVDALKPAEGGEAVPVAADAGAPSIRFVARKVPAFGYRTYVPVEAGSKPENRLRPEAGGAAGTAGNAGIREKGGDLHADAGAGVIENRWFRIALDPARGVIKSWIDKPSGREIVDGDAAQGFGSYLYERFDADQVAAYVNAYVKVKFDWALAELGKPAMPPAAQVPYRAASPRNGKLDIRQTPASVEAEMTFPTGGGIPHGVKTRVVLYGHQPYVDLFVTLEKKPADDWPEAGWIAFPFKVGAPQFRLGRLGSVVDPARDLVDGSNHDLFGIDTGVAVFDAGGHGAALCALDDPLISLDRPGCWRYDPEFVPRKPIIYVNLFNNQWSTNFRLWNEGTWTARARLWTFDAFDAEKSLVTPSLEARLGLMAAAASGGAESLPSSTDSAGTRSRLPLSAAGLKLSRKAVWVTAFGRNPDGPGTVLRLWELAGASGDCTVTLPGTMAAATVQPVDLRGRPQGEPLQTKQGAFTFRLDAFAPASFVITRDAEKR